MPAPSVLTLVDPPARRRAHLLLQRLVARVLGVSLVVASAWVFLTLLGR